MKLVTIKPFKGDAYNGWVLPADVAASQEFRISAQFETETSDTLRGLTNEEEKKYLPGILGVQPDAHSWREETKVYWANMSIIVPDEGLILNIDVNEDGTPEKMTDYIKWRFIAKHSEVAKNQKSCVWPTHRFYVIDAIEVKKDQTTDFEIRNEANKAFMHLQAEANFGKAKWVAECLRKSDEKIVHLSKADLYMFLETKKDEILADIENRGKFAETVRDPDLEQKAMIMQFLGAGILEKNGNSLFYGDSIIGTDKEAIAWFKNGGNSRQVLEMNEKLKAYA